MYIIWYIYIYIIYTYYTYIYIILSLISACTCVRVQCIIVFGVAAWHHCRNFSYGVEGVASGRAIVAAATDISSVDRFQSCVRSRVVRFAFRSSSARREYCSPSNLSVIARILYFDNINGNNFFYLTFCVCRVGFRFLVFVVSAVWLGSAISVVCLFVQIPAVVYWPDRSCFIYFFDFVSTSRLTFTHHQQLLASTSLYVCLYLCTEEKILRVCFSLVNGIRHREFWINYSSTVSDFYAKTI